MLNRKVQALPPTYEIKDPQTRAFCDALANAWQLRNGTTGHTDDQRFITKEEWDVIAKNPAIRALANIGRPGLDGIPGGDGTDGSDGGGGGGGGGTHYPPVVPPGLQSFIEFLGSQVGPVDFNHVLGVTNEIYGSLEVAKQELNAGIAEIKGILNNVVNGVTDITVTDADGTTTLRALKASNANALAGIVALNDVSVTSTSAAARSLAGMIAEVHDPNNGLAAAQAAIVQINTVTATSTSAAAHALWGMQAKVDDPVTGLVATNAMVVSVNDVSATSNSANARSLYGLTAQVNDPNTGLAKSYAMIGQINNVSATSDSAAARAIYTVTAMANMKNRVFVQNAPGPGTGVPAMVGDYVIKDNDLWIWPSNNYTLYRWAGGWVESHDPRIATTAAGLTTETTARTTSDSAMASAINSVWGYLGNGSLAVIQDGSQVILNPDAGSATRWTAVENSLKNANGVVTGASIRQEYDTYTSNADALARANWSVRVQTEVGGRVTVAGIGLYNEATTGGATTAFAISADRFIVTDGQSGTSYPFEVVGGNVYLKNAHIGNIITSQNYNGSTTSPLSDPGTAGWCINKNGDAAFNNIKVRNLDTNALLPGAATEMNGSSGSGSASCSINVVAGGRIAAWAYASGSSYTGDVTLSLSGGGLSGGVTQHLNHMVWNGNSNDDLNKPYFLVVCDQAAVSSTGSVMVTASGSGSINLVVFSSKR